MHESEADTTDPRLPSWSRRVLSVGEVTSAVRELLEAAFPRLSVRGEVTNLSRPQSGHLYFSLMDDAPEARTSRLSSAQISCVVWRSQAVRLQRIIENGRQVVVSGRMTVYEPRGTYQLIVDGAEAAGVGELQRRFEELKERLRLEGLFDDGRKSRLPFLPERIGIVTSPGGAAILDVLRALYRRFPRARVRIVPVRVQGEGAAEQIVAALDVLQAGRGQVDVILVTRGGGSLEDLWAFNEESLARAMARCRIPTVSAVGHEVDFSIADFVADARAQTPTKAAELLVPDLRELDRRLGDLRRRLPQALRSVSGRRERDLRRILRSRFVRRPETIVQDLVGRCDDLGRDLEIRLYNRKRQWEDRLVSLSRRIEALHPRRVLGRGYALVTDAQGRIVRDASRLEIGERLGLELARGTVHATVEDRTIPGDSDGDGSADELGEGPFPPRTNSTERERIRSIGMKDKGKKTGARGASASDARPALRRGQEKPEEVEPSFEEAFAQAEKSVDALERGDLTLEESLRTYEEGIRGLRRCYDVLGSFESRIEVLASDLGRVVEGDEGPVWAPAGTVPALQGAERAARREAELPAVDDAEDSDDDDDEGSPFADSTSG